MIRCAEEYDIDLDRDDAFKALEFTRAHTLKVAEQAFYISDQFLFPQKDEHHVVESRDSINGTGEEKRTKRAQSTTAEEGKNIGYPQGTKTKAISNALDCKQAVYASIETITTKTEDVATLLLKGQNIETLDQKHSKNSTGEESKYKDPEEILILDDLMIALENTIENSIKGAEAHMEKRTGEEAYSTVISPKARIDRQTEKSTQGEWNPDGNERAEQSSREKNGGEREEQRGVVEMPREINEPRAEVRREGARGTETELIKTSRYKPAEEHGQENEIACPTEEEENEMDPKTRVVARIGIGKRKPIATHRWRVRQQYKARRDDKVLTSCTIKIAIGDAIYLVSCYTKSKINGAHVFKCPTPWIIQEPKNEENKIDHPRRDEEYGVDATLWLTPTPRDDVVVAWKRIDQDPYARMRKGIGVCYHCGKFCERPSTCGARNKTCYICQRIGHTLGACEWRYKTKRVPTCSVPLHPYTQEQVCGELAEYVGDFLKIMEDGTQTANRPATILEHNATRGEAVTWLAEFERYFEGKEKELVSKGYRPVDHGRIVLNAYIDHELEMKLNHDKPRGAGVKIRGKQECIERLAQYFGSNNEGNDKTNPESMTPIDPVLDEEGWLLIDSLARHDGTQAAQAREHEQFKRRKGYASNTKIRHPASVPSVEQNTTLTDLPNEILEQICQYLPFRALHNLTKATGKRRNFSTIEKRLCRTISLTGEYLNESLIRRILTEMPTQYLDLSRVEMNNGPGAIEVDIQARGSSLKGICLSRFR